MRVVMYALRSAKDLDVEVSSKAAAMVALNQLNCRRVEVYLSKSQAKEFVADFNNISKISIGMGVELLELDNQDSINTIKALFDCAISRDLPYYKDDKSKITNEGSAFVENVSLVVVMQEQDAEVRRSVNKVRH